MGQALSTRVSRQPGDQVLWQMVDQPAIASWPHTSTVSTKPEDRTCPAPDQNNECGSCRQCWDPNIKNICYGKH